MLCDGICFEVTAPASVRDPPVSFLTIQGIPLQIGWGNLSFMSIIGPGNAELLNGGETMEGGTKHREEGEVLSAWVQFQDLALR